MRVLRVVLATFGIGVGLGGAAEAIGDEGRQKLLAGVEEVLFAVRQSYGGSGFYGSNAIAFFGEETQMVYFGEDPHWYANIGYHCDDATRWAFSGNGDHAEGRLMKLNLVTGETAVLLDAEGGAIRDPQVHYSGTKAVFAYLEAGSHYYHLYEIQLDGSGLRQLTDGPYDDFEPTYLPDGGIAFVSTRCRSWTGCWMTQVATVYRCDADGGNVRRLSFNTGQDNTPWVLPDGRILYTRWEYVDRSHVQFHHLWAMNPDGTNQLALFGNMHPGTVMIDAKPIPHTEKIVATFSPGHGITDHLGYVTVVSPKAGPDHRAMAQTLSDRPALVKDPYPLSEDAFLVAREKEILLMDADGDMQTLYTWPGEGGVYEPRAIRPRPREPVIPPRVNWRRSTGRLVLADICRSRHLEGVEPGEIKRLLILEDLPKPVSFSDDPDLISWLGTYNLKRVLGTVPVEEDGSAYFEVPAGRPVVFVALDKDDLSVKRMHSFTSVMPGEVTGCVGCHEPRTATPDLGTPADLKALRRLPTPIEPFEGFPDVLDFTRDIQPILDRHCVECHDHGKREGGVVLAGDLGPTWSHSYFSLLAHLQVADGRNGLGNYAPRTIGSSASPLLAKLGGGHYDVAVTAEEWRTVWLWIESGAPFAGSYAALRNEADQQVAGRVGWPIFSKQWRVFGRQRDILERRCSGCHALDDWRNEEGRALPFRPLVARADRGVDRPVAIHERVVIENDPLTRYSNHILLNFTRPHLSPLLLGPLAAEAGGYESCGAVFADTDDADYRQLLAAIERAKETLDARPRYGTPGFRPNRQYIREMVRFSVLPASFDPAGPLDVFATDEAYWQSLWLKPGGHDGH
ncbi:MAG: hypothetical protein RBS80_22005 [Thermoguttaceae bacterium]|jgi:hypothetical protein|nr:hypothetical protein [Thermoguttaceae bacterium]